MADSSSSVVEIVTVNPSAPPPAPLSQSTVVVPISNPPSSSINNTVHADKTLITSTANLAKLLPTCTVLIFQVLSPVLTNHGSTCRTPNKILAVFLIFICAFMCFILSFSDSFTGPADGKLYYGIATFKGFYIINNNYTNSGGEEDSNLTEVSGLTENLMKKYKISFVDGIHAILSSLLFISIAFTDSNIETCLFPSESLVDLQQLFTSLTIGLGLLCTLVFMVFPSNRKGIGYTDSPNYKSTN